MLYLNLLVTVDKETQFFNKMRMYEFNIAFFKHIAKIINHSYRFVFIELIYEYQSRNNNTKLAPIKKTNINFLLLLFLSLAVISC